MATKDKRIDAYIAQAPEFAKPILKRLRELVHEACPNVEETIKWSNPHFDYHGVMCGVMAFKDNCAFNLWKGELILNAAGERFDRTWGDDGRFRTLADLPAKKEFIAAVRKAMVLNEEGTQPPKAPAKPRADPTTPDDLSAALKKNTNAAAAFDAFPPSHKREYVEWITEAKREETRARRIAQAVEWMSSGKSRNWKYQ